MCTVTFTPNNDNGFVLTSSRDEIVSRGATIFPIKGQLDKETVFFPQDPKAGGTWVATSESGKVVCLLNGGFEKHKHSPPYRISRGKVVLDSFEYENFSDFANAYDLDNVEPFTLILIEKNKIKINLFELIWDGKEKHFNKIDENKTHIWSSSTLYTKEVREIRMKWFNDWVIKNGQSKSSLMNFHQFGGNISEEFNIKMKRHNGPETVSITQVSIENRSLSKEHKNFITDKNNSIQFEIKTLSNA